MHYYSSRVDSKRKQFFVLDKQSVGDALEQLFLVLWLLEELVPERALAPNQHQNHCDGKGGSISGVFFCVSVWSNSVTV